MVWVSISEEELSRLKAAQQAAPEEAREERWYVVKFDTIEKAVSYANAAPAQQSGEFKVTCGPDRAFYGCYYSHPPV